MKILKLLNHRETLERTFDAPLNFKIRILDGDIFFFFVLFLKAQLSKKKLLKRLGLCLKRKQSSLGNNAEIVGSDALAFSSGLPVTVIDICCFLLFVFFLVTYLVNFRYLSGCGQ